MRGGDRRAATRRWPTTARWSRRIESTAAARLGDAFRPSLQPVINATGVIIHTNLGPRAARGRGDRSRRRRSRAGTRRSSTTSAAATRGRRDVHAEALLCRLTGAEAAVVVNNNAAATMIVLAALAAGREVIVSRGELVEIGGGFRVPDVMAQSGASLREVGTTNKTRVADYAAAISERTALILRVHPSNFQDRGVHGAADARRARRARQAVQRARRRRSRQRLSRRVPVREPRPGSTARLRLPIGASRRSQTAIAAGVDVCCFSGDKLLGGPQAGIIVGRAALVDRIRTASADARAARRQDDLRRARGDAGGVRGRPRGRDRARAADADA